MQLYYDKVDMSHPSMALLCLCGCVLVAVDGCLWLPMPADMQMCKIYKISKAAKICRNSEIYNNL